MKTKLLGVVAALATFGFANQASAATVNFYDTQAAFNAASSTTLLEDFSGPGSALSGHGVASITRHGVTYTDVSSGNPDPDIVVVPPGQNNWGANVGTTTEYIITTDYDEHIRAAFSSTYTAVGFTAYFNGLGPGTLTVFGTGGLTIGTFALPTSGVDPATGLADRGYLGFTSTDPITGFQWDTIGGTNLNTGFTNISVGSATPLPGTLPLFASGLGMLGLLGWRRKRKAQAAA